jgi:hypothetical protein
MPEYSGTIADITNKLTTFNQTPLAIHRIWLDPISDQLKCVIETNNKSDEGIHIHDFTIVPAEGAVIKKDGWQLFGDPLPLIPYEGRSSTLNPDFPAPAYYQALIKPVQQRSTHREGVLLWVDKHLQSHFNLCISPRIIHPSLLTKISKEQHIASETPKQNYNALRMSALAPPWHPKAGHYVLVIPQYSITTGSKANQA